MPLETFLFNFYTMYLFFVFLGFLELRIFYLNCSASQRVFLYIIILKFQLRIFILSRRGPFIFLWLLLFCFRIFVQVSSSVFVSFELVHAVPNLKLAFYCFKSLYFSNYFFFSRSSLIYCFCSFALSIFFYFFSGSIFLQYLEFYYLNIFLISVNFIYKKTLFLL